MNGAQAITAILTAQGVGSVFSVAGASHSYLLDALDRAGVKILSNRHESGAVGCADGYARAFADQRPERVGVALIVRDQGLANAVGGLAVAYAAGSPVLVLVAAPPSGTAEAAGLLDHDQLALVAPVSKWARTVPGAERLVDYTQTAIRQALDGRPGPVVLVIPQDLFQAEVGDVSPQPHVRPIAVPDSAALDDAAALLSAARRPIAIAGLGAHRGRAGAALRALAGRGVPVLGNGSGRGLVAEDLRTGFSWPYAQRAAHLADLVLVVGEVLTQRLGFGLPPRFSTEAKFIQIDCDSAAFHRNRRTDVALTGEPGAVLEALLERIESRWDCAWLGKALAEKANVLSERADRLGADIHPLALGKALAEYLDPHTMLVGDGADIQNWMYGALRVQRPGGFMDHYPMGAMGSGTALAVGAASALAEQARADGEIAPMTLLVTGDGSIGFHPAELHAAALAGLNLKVLVGNDAAWGTEAHGQMEALGRTINTELGGLPYARLAEAFGLPGATCGDPQQLRHAVAALMALPGPALLDVKLDRQAGAELKTNPLISSIQFSDIADGQNALVSTA